MKNSQLEEGIEQRLFVYGTLAPGRPNEHVLAPLGGRWQAATVRGHLRQDGWGAGLGYPALVPDAAGDAVRGFIFTAQGLAGFWGELDRFEGAQYARAPVEAYLDEGGAVNAYAYVLRQD